MSEKRAHLGELDWARHLSNERGGLSGWRRRRHLASCATCRALEAQLAQERRAFDENPRRAEEAAELAGRAAMAPPHEAGPRRLPWPWLLAAAGAAAVVFLVQAPSTGPLLTAKGSDVFTLYLDRPEGAVALGPRCRPGDRLIARYRTSRPYLLILERDGRGVVQVLHPQGGQRSAAVTGPEGTTPTSWILDDAGGRECFAAFFSEVPIEAAVAGGVLAGAQAPALPGAVVRVQCCDKDGAR